MVQRVLLWPGLVLKTRPALCQRVFFSDRGLPISHHKLPYSSSVLLSNLVLTTAMITLLPRSCLAVTAGRGRVLETSVVPETSKGQATPNKAHLVDTTFIIAAALVVQASYESGQWLCCGSSLPLERGFLSVH